jgi:hypothetical protein
VWLRERRSIFPGIFKIVPIYIPQFEKDCQMYISLGDSCTKGFKKWSDAHQPEIKNDVRAGEGYAVVATDLDLDLDNRVRTSPEQPHRPWLVPGVGRL